MLIPCRETTADKGKRDSHPKGRVKEGIRMCCILNRNNVTRAESEAQTCHEPSHREINMGQQCKEWSSLVGRSHGLCDNTCIVAIKSNSGYGRDLGQGQDHASGSRSAARTAIDSLPPSRSRALHHPRCVG